MARSTSLSSMSMLVRLMHTMIHLVVYRGVHEPCLPGSRQLGDRLLDALGQHAQVGHGVTVAGEAEDQAAVVGEESDGDRHAGEDQDVRKRLEQTGTYLV